MELPDVEYRQSAADGTNAMDSRTAEYSLLTSTGKAALAFSGISDGHYRAQRQGGRTICKTLSAKSKTFS